MYIYTYTYGQWHKLMNAIVHLDCALCTLYIKCNVVLCCAVYLFVIGKCENHISKRTNAISLHSVVVCKWHNTPTFTIGFIFCLLFYIWLFYRSIFRVQESAIELDRNRLYILTFCFLPKLLSMSAKTLSSK